MESVHPIQVTAVYQPPKPKLVFGIPSVDQLSAMKLEAMLQGLFPRHEIVLLGGFAGMMEVRG